MEPAYTNGLYSRTDRWQINTRAVPGEAFEIAEEVDLNASAGVRFSAEAKFIRFVKDPCRAITLLPYTPKRMPLRARVAIGDKFKVGDYFVFRGSSAFVASAEILSLLSSNFWGAGFSGHFLMEGYYQLHIVRLDEEHIRMKVVGRRGKGLGLALNAGWTGDFDVFSVSSLNNNLEKIVNTTPLRLKANWDNSNIFMLDYVLDLTDETVAKAFDKVLANAQGFKQLRLVNPFKNTDDISGMLLLDLAPLEDLFQEDRRNGQIGRLKRNLRTSSSQTSRGWGIDLGNRIFGWEWDKRSSNSFMKVRRDDNSIDRYILRSWETESEGRFFYRWSKSKKRAGLRALFQTDEKREKNRPVNLVSYLERKKNRLSHGAFKGIKTMLKKALPHAVFSKIPWERWTQNGKNFTNFGLRYDFIVSPEAITQAPQLNAKEIEKRFLAYTFEKGLTYDDFFNRRRNNRPGSHRNHNDWESPKEQFERHLRLFAKRVERILNRDLPDRQRLAELDRLRRNFLFQASGFGFLMSIMPDKMRERFHVDLYLSANEAKIDFNYGDSKLSALYKKLLTIKAALDDDGLDLLREAQSLSVTY